MITLYMFSDGIFIIDKDIQAGTYKWDGGKYGYWSKLKDASGSLNSVIANNVIEG